MSRLWKEGLIFAIFLILFSLPILADETCQSAVPKYGSIVCREQGVDEPKSVTLIKSGTDITAQLTCLSNCQLKISDIKDSQGNALGAGSSKFCGNTVDDLWYYVYKKGLKEIWKEGAFDSVHGTSPLTFGREDSVSIVMFCKFLGSKTNNIADGSTASFTQKKIMLEEAWAGNLEYVPVPNTEDCTLNKVVEKSKYQADTFVSSYLDPLTGNTVSKSQGTYASLNELPTNWKVSDSYIFVYSWDTSIADISFTYDKQNNVYWCGGLSGSRKIYNVNKITSASGACYAIPTSIYLPNIECCFPPDCSWKGTKYTCNPDTWKCEETRQCDSQLECDQVFGSGVCQNKQITGWVCNTNKKWGTRAGTCEKSIRNVQQCPSDCTASEYYNEEEGICKSRVTILNCPAGKCCKSGGSYKEKSCDAGLECCTVSGSIIGECKTSCAPPPQTTQQQKEAQETNNLVAEGMINPQPLDTGLILIVVSVIAVGGGAASYFLFLKKPKIPTTPVSKKVSEKFCTKCGTSLKSGKGFCTKCGKKVK